MGSTNSNESYIPKWSSDSSKLFFHSDIFYPNQSGGIFSIGRDGSNFQQLSYLSQRVSGTGWAVSPDNNDIAYTVIGTYPDTGNDRFLWTIDSNGLNGRKINVSVDNPENISWAKASSP